MQSKTNHNIMPSTLAFVYMIEPINLINLGINQSQTRLFNTTFE